MIREVEIDGEKVLEVDSVEEFSKAVRRGLPIIAPEAVRRAWGSPDEQEDVGTTADIREAEKDAYKPGFGAWKVLATLLVTIAFALPAAAQSDETAKSFHILPHLADGGGWGSLLLVTNVSQLASHCTFNVYGMPLNRFREFSSFVTVAGSTATFQLEGPGGHLRWPTKGESALASGYATLDCSAPVVAQLVFVSDQRVLGGDGMATVFSSQAATVFQFPVLTPEGTLGFAIANDTNAGASCRIVLQDLQRTNLGEATLTVSAKSNRVQLLNAAISIREHSSEGRRSLCAISRSR